MNPERKAKLKELRGKLANLTPEARQILISRGLIATVEGRTLSLHNTLLVYLQANHTLPSVVGGYQQWRRAGKQVRRGEHGYMIWFPVGHKNEENELIEVDTFYTATVFDIGQIESIEGRSK